MIEEAEIKDLVEESAPSTPEDETVETPETDESGKKEDLPEGIKKRFSKLTTDKYRLKSSLEAREIELAEIRAENERLKQPPDERPKKPNEDDFDDYKEYEKARDKYDEEMPRWAARQEYREQSTKTQKTEVTKRQEEFEKNFHSLAEKLEVDNVDEKVVKVMNDLNDSGLQMPPHIADALFMDKKAGPKIFEHLAENPEKMVEIVNMGFIESVQEIGRISDKISNGKPKEKTKASNPVEPIKGSSTRKRKMADLTMEEIVNGDLSEFGFTDR
jgi:hypothetical protein